MPQTIKVSDELAELLREDANKAERSLASQLEYYAQVGRRIVRSPDFDTHDIEAVLSDGIEVDEISLEAQEAFFAEFESLLKKTATNAEEFFAKRRAEGKGVGETEDGQLVRQLAGGLVTLVH